VLLRTGEAALSRSGNVPLYVPRRRYLTAEIRDAILVLEWARLVQVRPSPIDANEPAAEVGATAVDPVKPATAAPHGGCALSGRRGRPR
jgi:hypothetical protein